MSYYTSLRVNLKYEKSMAICWSLHSLIYVTVCYTMVEPYVNIRLVMPLIDYNYSYYFLLQIKTCSCPLYALFQKHTIGNNTEYIRAPTLIIFYIEYKIWTYNLAYTFLTYVLMVYITRAKPNHISFKYGCSFLKSNYIKSTYILMRFNFQPMTLHRSF